MTPTSDRLARALSGVATVLSVGLLVGLLGVLLFRGLGALWGPPPTLSPAELGALRPEEQASFLSAFRAHPGLGELLFGGTWSPEDPVQPRFGAGGMLLATGLTALTAMGIAAPLGLGAAAWLVCAAPAGLRSLVRPFLELLAGIPTVALGLVALVLIEPLLSAQPGGHGGLSALNGALMLAFMALPTVTALSVRALESVPADRIRASLALGADRWQTLLRVSLPSASAGVAAAVTLGLGRALGETMIVLMACGNALEPTLNLLDPVRTLTATLALEFDATHPGSGHREALYAVGLLLFVLTFTVNLAGELLFARQEARS
ncbi:MAG: phosphate ABC transporter permease subunit PstC [Alphaproteobacteria bacterium]|nr:phosphate ABC transporter permease subunit PstC [Alphaproteobacteria bacterium]